MSFKGTYSMLAAGLAVTGLLLSLLAYLVLRSTPLAALGISAVLLAGVSFAISKGQPKISPEASAMFLQSGVENISAVVEELGIKSKAIYLPSSLTGDKPKALIPLDSNVDLGSRVLPKRFIVKYGSSPTDVGLLVITSGSAVGGSVEAKPDCTAGDIESAVSQVLSGTLSLADGVRVSMDSEKILVEVGGSRLESGKMWVYDILGTPMASLVASIAAQVLDKPVSITSESFSKGKCVVKLQVMRRSL